MSQVKEVSPQKVSTSEINSCDIQGISGEIVNEFVYLLVRDYISINRMDETLKSFDYESRIRNMKLPQADTWYQISNAIQLSKILQQNDDPNSSSKASILDIVIQKFIFEHRKVIRAEAPTTVLISKHASMLSLNDVERKNAEKSLRYTHSTPVLLVATQDNSDTTQNTEKAIHTLDGRTKSTKSITLSRGIPKLHEPDPCLLIRADRIQKARSDTKRSTTPNRMLRNKSNSQLEENSKNKRIRPKSHIGTSPLPTLHYNHESIPRLGREKASEDFENRPRSRESWIPSDRRYRMLQREFAAVAQSQREKEIYDEGIRKFDEREKIEECMEQRSNEANLKKDMNCRLCEVSYKRHNLPTRVSYKLIMNLRKAWDPNLSELNPVLARPPRCYDQVRVCRYCTQFIESMDIYLATPEEATIAQVEKKLLEDEEKRDKKHKDSLGFDPLEWDPYNSDDDANETKTPYDNQVWQTGEESPLRNKKRESIKLKTTSLHAAGVVGKRFSYHQMKVLDYDHLDEHEWKSIKDVKSPMFKYKRPETRGYHPK